MSGLVRSQLAQRCKRPDLPREFLVNHVAGSFVEMVLWWIKGHMRQTPAELDRYFLAVMEPIL